MRDLKSELNPLVRLRLLVRIWDEIIWECIKEKFPKYTKETPEESLKSIVKDFRSSLYPELIDTIFSSYRHIRYLRYMLFVRKIFQENLIFSQPDYYKKIAVDELGGALDSKLIEKINEGKQKREIKGFPPEEIDYSNMAPGELCRHVIKVMLYTFESILVDLTWRTSHYSSEVKKDIYPIKWYIYGLDLLCRSESIGGFLGFFGASDFAEKIKIRVLENELIDMNTLSEDLADYASLKIEKAKNKLSKNRQGLFSVIKPLESKNLELIERLDIQNRELEAAQQKLEIVKSGQSLLQREMEKLASQNQTLQLSLNKTKLKKRELKAQLEEQNLLSGYTN